MQVNLINGEDVTLSDQLEEFWRVESYGTSKCETKPLSVEDQRAMNLISNSIRKHDGHYKMGVLWKSDNPVLPSEVIRTVRRNFYVVDVIPLAIPLASDLVKLLREGGFRLTRFASNSRELLASIPPASRRIPSWT